ncbi:uncharacterized protein si:ch211-57n23.1 [Dunckerocampus dactyliophorus]|uniref:uncharacterized protein si:ch211-57n23.1 n=1 Tax=Dunckerocampus dactyliophorus TaxID=161453 RepID=UPI00240564C5|nr:uncharacterized protein si:ch211-57n23.1 [Dunckerocampus dactyliophorus]
MLWGSIWGSWLLLGFSVHVATSPLDLQISGDPDQADWTDEWGSGFSPLHFLPADSPTTAEPPHRALNCTQRFWLPPTSGVCWEKVAGPQEFAKSRLLVLQNRAALHAITSSSGVDEGGLSYDNQAREEVRAILTDHQSVVEAIEKMEKVFISLEETRKDGKEQGFLRSMKERMARTREVGYARELTAATLERRLSTLEDSLLAMQIRLNKLILH